MFVTLHPITLRNIACRFRKKPEDKSVSKEGI